MVVWYFKLTFSCSNDSIGFLLCLTFLTNPFRQVLLRCCANDAVSMELTGRPLLAEGGYISDSEVTEDPSLEGEDILQQTDEVHHESKDKDQADDVEADNVEETSGDVQTEERKYDFRLPFIVGIAFVALSAVYVTVRRILRANTLSDGRHEAHPKKALVTKTWRPPTQKGRTPGLPPDNNLTFVVSEEYVNRTNSHRVRVLL